VGRYFVEGIRLDNIYNISGMHLAQYTSLIFIGFGIFGLVLIYIGRKYSFIRRDDMLDTIDKDIVEIEKLEEELANIRKHSKITKSNY
jgi:hypothetical protein